jgi:hypothetical protein
MYKIKIFTLKVNLIKKMFILQKLKIKIINIKAILKVMIKDMKIIYK